MIGDKFELLVECLGNNPGTCGYIYDEYPDFDVRDKKGISLIFPNGNYDGFSLQEQLRMLQFIDHEPIYQGYVFQNVTQLVNDFRKGFWKFETSPGVVQHQVDWLEASPERSSDALTDDSYTGQIATLKRQINSLRSILQVVMDQVDWTAGNCRVNEAVGAVLSEEIIKQVRRLLKETS